MVERATRFTVLVQLDGRDMGTVTAGLSRTMARLPEQVRKSLTRDRGMELADHNTVTANTGLAVYFADPRRPAARHEREHQPVPAAVLPEGNQHDGLTRNDLDAVAAKLKSRPRRDARLRHAGR